MIKQCLNKDMMNVGYCFSPCCDIYKMPEAKTMNDYIECIKKLPS